MLGIVRGVLTDRQGVIRIRAVARRRQRPAATLQERAIVLELAPWVKAPRPIWWSVPVPPRRCFLRDKK